MIDLTEEQILEAIKDSGGIILRIAQRLKVEWHTAKKYCEMYEETRQALDNEAEKILDMSEIAALKKIQDGDGPMIRYMLSTKGKKRGYVERQEFSGIDGKDLTIVIERE